MKKKEENALPVQEIYLFLHTFSQRKGRQKKQKQTVLSHHAGITQLVE